MVKILKIKKKRSNLLDVFITTSPPTGAIFNRITVIYVVVSYSKTITGFLNLESLL